MKTKQECKDEVAKKYGAENWYQLNRYKEGNIDLYPTKTYIEQAMDLYAKQFVLKAIDIQEQRLNDINKL